MSSKAMKRAFFLFLLSVGLLALVGWGLARYALNYPDRPQSSNQTAQAIVIPKGKNFVDVVEILSQKQLIKSPTVFRFYANFRGLANKVRAGTYQIKPSLTPRELLELLVHGAAEQQVTVVLPEGKNMMDLASLLAKAGVCDERDLLQAMRDRIFLRRIGVPGSTMEGYLFPDTYKFRSHTSAQEVLTKLFRHHQQTYLELTAKYRGSLKMLRKKLRWGHPEIVTLASIVEKETGKKFERPLIAGVFLNRLLLPNFPSRRLETDPTIIYGCTVPEEKSAACQKFEGRIRRIHLEDSENPYNTYRHAELPPGPISNPGREALEAVLAPKKSNYLYFVSKNDGTHYFSSTREEHERAVDKYQRHNN